MLNTFSFWIFPKIGCHLILQAVLSMMKGMVTTERFFSSSNDQLIDVH